MTQVVPEGGERRAAVARRGVHAARTRAFTAALGRALAWLVGDVLRVRRAHVEQAMTTARVPSPSLTARAMYHELGQGLIELLAVSVRGLPAGRALEEPLAELGRLRGPGRGVVVATAHTGSWDVVACTVASRTPLTVVTKHLSVGLLDRLWQGTRRRRGVKLVAAGEVVREAGAALRRGETVAMLVDQAPERSRAVVLAPFLGAPAWVDLAPALCAMRHRAPLVAAFGYRAEDGSHGVKLAGVFSPPLRPSRRWAEETMLAVTALLDAHVRERPAQWLWMHRRWKGVSREAAAALALPAASAS